MSAASKVLHEWELAGYHGRIVETQPGIVTSEQAMDDDKRGRLWVSNRCPIGWPNEMIHLAMALRAAQAERDALRAAADWVIHVECGVGKSGEPPTLAERREAFVAMRAALEEKT